MLKRYRLECIVEVEDDTLEMPALMDIIFENSSLTSKAVEITEITCSEDSGPLMDEGNDFENVPAADLDEHDSGVWLCRWPNGDSSVVYAETKRQAMGILDQWGPADPALMKKLESFGVDIRLTDDAEFELGDLDETFAGELYDFSYSHLKDAFSLEDEADNLRLKREAVLVEREKFSALPPLTEAETEGGRQHMELGMGLSPAVADLWAQQAAERKSESEEEE
jgi:hypothetical protein